MKMKNRIENENEIEKKTLEIRLKIIWGKNENEIENKKCDWKQNWKWNDIENKKKIQLHFLNEN